MKEQHKAQALEDNFLISSREMRLYSNKWLFQCPDTGEFFEVSLEKKNVNHHWVTFYKLYIEYKLGGFKGPGFLLKASRSSIKVISECSLTFLVWATQSYPNTYLSDFTEGMVNEFVNHLFDLRMAYGTLTLRMQILRDSHDAFLLKHIPDGITFSIDYLGRKPRPNSILSAICNERGIDFFEWGARKPHGSIPIYTAMALLNYALQEIRSGKANFASEYYSLFRKYKERFAEDRLRIVFRNLFSFYKDHLISGNIDFLWFIGGGKSCATSKVLRDQYYESKNRNQFFCPKAFHAKYRLKKYEYQQVESFERQKQSWDLYYNLATDFIEIARANLSETQARKLSHASLVSYVKNELRYSTLTVLLTLTGARSWSEISQMTADDFTPSRSSSDGVIFKTQIKKTNHGIPKDRMIYNLAMEAVSRLQSCRNTSDSDIFLFSNDFLSLRNHKSAVNTAPLGPGALSQGLRKYYDKFAKSQPLLTKKHPEIKAHQFRHTWAEFALRMFEGNVSEEIRRHFAHSYGSFMQETYTSEKLKDEIADDLVSSYLKEILTRIVDEAVLKSINSEYLSDIQGSAAELIIKASDEIVTTPEKAHEFVEQLADDYVHIRAHEYGYCLSRKDHEKHANCYDKNFGSPDYNGACFKVCINCINFCASRTNNEAALIRQSIAHRNFANIRMKLLNVDSEDTFVKTSLKASELGERFLKKWQEE
ncbi:hypothetical protein GTH32_16605 [Alteromonas sp. 345S023]|uniref:Uncharacterized protein n=1 Tax=Alteromonas profundi TaxID=2696062 RepID=A0A7X5RM79_9ALTE|nr:hypothetical protein [Alteromonas profundi]NDV92793.1 hypothetical protein [Alteromonas profundi]